jgi:hypothetical protein
MENSCLAGELARICLISWQFLLEGNGAHYINLIFLLTLTRKLIKNICKTLHVLVTDCFSFPVKYAISRKMFQKMFEYNKTCVILHTYPPMKMEQTDCSETLSYKIQMPGELPRRKHKTIWTRRKFEIKKDLCYRVRCYLLKFSRFMTEPYNNWHLRSIPSITVFAKGMFFV